MVAIGARSDAAIAQARGNRNKDVIGQYNKDGTGVTGTRKERVTFDVEGNEVSKEEEQAAAEESIVNPAQFVTGVQAGIAAAQVYLEGANTAEKLETVLSSLMGILHRVTNAAAGVVRAAEVDAQDVGQKAAQMTAASAAHAIAPVTQADWRKHVRATCRSNKKSAGPVAVLGWRV